MQGAVMTIFRSRLRPEHAGEYAEAAEEMDSLVRAQPGFVDAKTFTAADAASMQRAVAAIGVESPMQRLLRVYQTAMRGYRDGVPLFRALLQLHEIENVKLLWRATAKPAPAATAISRSVGHAGR